MIDVIIFKNDVYLGKQTSKTYPCATEEKALSRANALASVNKVPASMVQEKRNDAGELLQILIDASPPPSVEAPASKDEEIEELRARIEKLEELVARLGETHFTMDKEG